MFTRYFPASWVGPDLVTLVGLRPPSLLVPLPTRVAGRASPGGKERVTRLSDGRSGLSLTFHAFPFLR